MERTQETKDKISKSMQKLWKTKEFREKIIKKQIALGYRFADPVSKNIK